MKLYILTNDRMTLIVKAQTQLQAACYANDYLFDRSKITFDTNDAIELHTDREFGVICTQVAQTSLKFTE